MLVNSQKKACWCKIHFISEQGFKTLTDAEASKLKSTDPDHATRDLFESIKKGDYPAWKAYFQIMPFEDAATYKFDPFDITKVWPHKDCK